MHSNYRPDIDGLRALAVLCVVLFHAFPTVLPGGFIGVDLFFVISGFLICTILFSQFEAGTFSVWDFYDRRIRRIFPALILVLFSCYAFGWLTLFADEYMQLGKHITAGTGFISNFVFWQEAGYFDNVADTKPLLHLWSLGIEEQFYIIWPLVLWLGYRFKANLLVITILVAITSFVLNIRGINIKHDLVATFYSPQTRFWELLLGAILAYVTLHPIQRLNGFTANPEQHQKIQSAQSALGLVLVALGVALIHKQSPFPGWWALLPTLGAVLIIHAGPKAVINRHLLSNKLMVWMGLISYPLYLWHWPILSFLRIIEGEVPKVELRIVAVALSLILSTLTYLLVERPIRFGKKSLRKVTTIILALLMAIVGYLGYTSYQRQGLSDRDLNDNNSYANLFAPEKLNTELNQHGRLVKNFMFDCDFLNFSDFSKTILEVDSITNIPQYCYNRNESKDPVVFLWGDSHAQMLHYGLTMNLPSNISLSQVARAACKPQATESPDIACSKTNQFALNEIARIKPMAVIVAQRDAWDQNHIASIHKRLTELGAKKVIFVGKSPEWKSSLPKIIFRQHWTSIPNRTFIQLEAIDSNYENSLKKFTASLSNSAFISLTDYFCNTSGCLVYLGDNPKLGLTAFDSNHLSPAASSAIARDVFIPEILKAN
ncbi:acyltransferase [Polynucleobacter sp. 15G-AUS-farblos]|uniref:acyltransferase family protein n=1 Tax=Polynucleobacter sp. 15G-AUS-farblos TaxID=2689094 RepID=UPI001C0E0E4A|nr:acyltransferase family protein [Polynucleobacter sp. 15G-AUS-farblos]MBU3584120.1 acyltransferase [Polynucleobacter sp. 15G-AUS-farblos]